MSNVVAALPSRKPFYMADHKLNVLHWHLSDDESWRLPVEGIVSSSDSYSREDLREVVAFAKARHVRIVPEVDLPGHARALVRAKPDLACFPNGVGLPRTASAAWCVRGKTRPSRVRSQSG